jgi:adenosylmethionine-8-amino-7-oxononanoate aminotransferase
VHRHGILLILDEVMCGMGRCGTLHACAAEGVVPDLLTIAKGLGGGYQPIGAVLAQRAMVDSFIAKAAALFQHGHTYIGHAVACAAALAVQRVMQRDGCWPPCSSVAPACSGGCCMPLHNTHMSATCAAAASSGGSNSWPSARARRRSTPR